MTWVTRRLAVNEVLAATRLGMQSLLTYFVPRLLATIHPRRRSARRSQRDDQERDPNYKQERFLHARRDPTGPKADSGVAVSDAEQEQMQPAGDGAAGHEIQRPPAKACAEPAQHSS